MWSFFRSLTHISLSPMRSGNAWIAGRPNEYSSTVAALKTGRYVWTMSKVEEIKRAIEQLPKEDFWHLSGWVLQRHEDEWDQQIEQDIRAGKLDKFAEEALREERE